MCIYKCFFIGLHDVSLLLLSFLMQGLLVFGRCDFNSHLPDLAQL